MKEYRSGFLSCLPTSKERSGWSTCYIAGFGGESTVIGGVLASSSHLILFRRPPVTNGIWSLPPMGMLEKIELPDNADVEAVGRASYFRASHSVQIRLLPHAVIGCLTRTSVESQSRIRMK
jgi:hypothetical protein